MQKSARPDVQYVNLNHNARENKPYTNEGLLNLGLRVSASWLLKEMYKESVLILLAGIAGTRPLGPYFLPTTSACGSYHDLLQNVLLERLQDVASADCDSFLVHVTCSSSTVSSCSLRNLKQLFPEHCTVRGGPTAWPARSPDFNSLLLLSQVTSTVYCLCYSSQWRLGLAVTHAEWIWDDQYNWNFPVVRQSLLGNQRLALKLSVERLKILFNLLEDVTRKPWFIRFMRVKYIFLVLCCRLASCRFCFLCLIHSVSWDR
jgi:hypothetical protein